MIDWSQVNILKEDVGAENFDEIVELFLREVDAISARLRDHPAPEMMEEHLHALKGSAMNMGFNYFAGLCQRGESLAAAGKADVVDLPAILQGFVESKREFFLGLPRKASGPSE